MISLGLNVRTLATTRFSVSPTMEAVAWLRLAATKRRHAVLGDPGPAARTALRHPDVALIVDLLQASDGAYLPDFLTPQPRVGPWPSVLENQLAEMESARQEDVHTQAMSLAGEHSRRPMSHRVRRLTEAGLLHQRVAAGLARFWRHALHDGWPSLQAAIDHDIARRSRLIAVHGIGEVLGHLHPAIRWTGDSLTIDTRHERKVDLAGHELVLAATALIGPRVMFQVDEAAPGTVYYPAGGIGRTARPDGTELTDVVGAVRAALLTDLHVGRSTTELAVRRAVSPSTVSYHLAALHRAGLVAKDREGRHVLYRRTERAETLLDHAGPRNGS